jgi:hypothetical protein
MKSWNRVNLTLTRRATLIQMNYEEQMKIAKQCFAQTSNLSAKCNFGHFRRLSCNTASSFRHVLSSSVSVSTNKSLDLVAPAHSS